MLMGFDPFRELDRLVGRHTARWDAGPFPMDARRSGDALTIEFDLPGVDPSAIDVSVHGGELTVTAPREWDVPEGADVIAAERRHGRFTRRLMLGESLDSERLEAHCDNGVLTLRIPVARSAQPRRIEVGRRHPALAA